MFLTRKSPFHFQQYLELTHDVYMQFYCTLVDDWILVEQTYVSLGQVRPPTPLLSLPYVCLLNYATNHFSIWQLYRFEDELSSHLNGYMYLLTGLYQLLK